MFVRRRLSSVAWWGLLTATTAACSVLVNPDPDRLPGGDARTGDGTVMDALPTDTPINPDGADQPPPDVRVDVPIPTDVARMCPTNCDDGIPCTIDNCNTVTGVCEHRADNTRCMSGNQICDLMRGCTTRPCMTNTDCDDRDRCNGMEICMGGACRGGTRLACDDGNFCNGVETCNAATGCVPAMAPTCDDMNPCTADRCDMAMNRCANAPIDADGDGVPAAMVMGRVCTGGTDCNDANPMINPRAMEVCNRMDDNCNGTADEGLSCGGVPNDNCMMATPITLATGVLVATMGTTAGATQSFDPGCGGSSGTPDVFYTFTYPSNNDLLVEVVALGGSDPIVALVDGCASGTLATTVCNDDARRANRNARITIRAAPGVGPGLVRTLMFGVDAFNNASAGPFTINAIAIASPSATCANPVDLTGGGAVLGAIPLRSTTTGGSCSASMPVINSGPEELFVYRGGPGRIDLRLDGRAGYGPNLYVRSRDCGGAEVRCQNGNPATTNFDASMGTQYFIFVDNGFGITRPVYVLTALVP